MGSVVLLYYYSGRLPPKVFLSLTKSTEKSLKPKRDNLGIFHHLHGIDYKGICMFFSTAVLTGWLENQQHISDFPTIILFLVFKQSNHTCTVQDIEVQHSETN